MPFSLFVFMERRRNDKTTLGGSDWSQSRIWRQIDVLVGVYDVLRPRGTTSGAYEETGEMRGVIKIRSQPPDSSHHNPLVRSSARSLYFGMDVFV